MEAAPTTSYGTTTNLPGKNCDKIVSSQNQVLHDKQVGKPSRNRVLDLVRMKHDAKWRQQTPAVKARPHARQVRVKHHAKWRQDVTACSTSPREDTT